MMPPRKFSIWTTAIVIVWDENDCSGLATQPNGLFSPPNQNKVVLTAETNRDGHAGVPSGTCYPEEEQVLALR
jgi:hypothetical protein